MKKAIVIPPSLLADMKRTSPDFYEYYKHSELARHEYIDYGFESEPMFMSLDVYVRLGNFAKEINTDISEYMHMLQAGYRAGISDLFAEFYYIFANGDSPQKAKRLLYISLHDHNVSEFERRRLINHKGIVCSNGTYIDGRYFKTWELLSLSHNLYNDYCKEINLSCKDLYLYYDIESDFGYPFN